MLLACALSFIIVMLWQEFVIKPTMENAPIPIPASQPKANNDNLIIDESASILPRIDEVSRGFTAGSRLPIRTLSINGSINLHGARIDDITLMRFREKLEADSSNVALLSPQNTRQFYFAEFGWMQQGSSIMLPDRNTLWQTDDNELSVEHPVKLTWINPQGVKFILDISIDNGYMVRVKQSVENNSRQPIALSSYAMLSRNYSYSSENNMLIHEGAINVFNNTLQEIEFQELNEGKKNVFVDQQGWLGFSDKYWLTALIPDVGAKISGKFIGYPNRQNEIQYQADMATSEQIVKPGEIYSSSTKLFAGAKELDLLQHYQGLYNIPLFDHAVDFGLLYFITKPIFLLLHYFHDLIGNFGVAILLLTVLIKLLLFPLAYKGFKGMNKMKDLQPQMNTLREKYNDDPAAMQQALLELYRKEQINPLAGCLPIILQMPVFFALYKVLYVTIEMRHAKFFAWIVDLSAPDPANIFTLFGLFPWPHPEFLNIGVLPIIMAFTMYIQQRLNPEPADPVQASVMRWLPAMFLFMFANFPSGLVLYWAWSNILSIGQQIFIKRITR
jgi:YidC/Oxa1 family membrane protein insertase